MTRRTRILIADDHAAIRAGLHEMLHHRIDFDVVGEASDGAAVLAAVARLKPDLIITDLTMPGMSGPDLLHAVRANDPRCALLVFTMHPADQYADFARRAGACGYVTKDASALQLIEAIDHVLSGGKWFPAGSTHRPRARPRSAAPTQDALARLSDRERAVILGIAFGKTQVEIGRMLGISSKTVATYRQRVLEKLQLKTNADLVALAMRVGMVS